MNHIAFIPMRSGSKEVPDKNIRDFCGKPLAWWTIKRLVDASPITEIVLAVDSQYVSFFSSLAEELDSEKIDIYTRTTKNARDTSTTEDVVLEYIDHRYKEPDKSYDRFLLVQVTNPFLQTDDIESAVEWFETDMAIQSIISCAPLHRFVWKREQGMGQGQPVNYNHHERPLRQEWDGRQYVVENGSFYLSTVQRIWHVRNRISGNIGMYLMPEYSSVEIDSEDDFIGAERLFRENELDTE